MPGGSVNISTGKPPFRKKAGKKGFLKVWKTREKIKPGKPAGEGRFFGQGERRPSRGNREGMNRRKGRGTAGERGRVSAAAKEARRTIPRPGDPGMRAPLP
ncbi:MAG: hypothetical protein BAA03_02985 [Caldibacillus debilis]|nr:MAG: hypothetical protein BAA03_02985 [Caldibacillus debilis]